MKKHLLFLSITLILCCSLVGCGESTVVGSTSGNNKAKVSDNETNDNNDLMDKVGNAANDMINGAQNAVDDLIGENGFTNYSDAHDYFLDTMGSYHSDAQFELRDEKEDLYDYQEGSKGYRFSLYDTSNNEKGDMFGEFYVDATSGLIYRLGSNGKVEEYPTKNNSNSTSNSNSAKNTGNSNSTTNAGNSNSANNADYSHK